VGERKNWRCGGVNSEQTKTPSIKKGCSVSGGRVEDLNFCIQVKG